MPRHHLEIQTNVPGDNRVSIDGHDITNAVRGIVWHAHHDERPTATIYLATVDITTINSPHTELLISDDVAEALTAMGWTPPPSDR
jgi:hypothetical protein